MFKIFWRCFLWVVTQQVISADRIQTGNQNLPFLKDRDQQKIPLSGTSEPHKAPVFATTTNSSRQLLQSTTCSVVLPGQYFQLHFSEGYSCIVLRSDVTPSDTVTLFFDFYHRYIVNANWGSVCAFPEHTVQKEGQLDFRIPKSCPLSNVTVQFSVRFMRVPPIDADVAHPIQTDYLFLHTAIVRQRILSVDDSRHLAALFQETCGRFQSQDFRMPGIPSPGLGFPFSGSPSVSGASHVSWKEKCSWYLPLMMTTDSGEPNAEKWRVNAECSSLHGFTCSPEGFLTGLHLEQRGLRIKNLTEALWPFRKTLETVAVSGNAVEGKLAADFFFHFPKLKVFHAEFTDLGSDSALPCPADVKTSLVQSLKLGWTAFKGPFPLCWLRSPALRLFSTDFAGFDPGTPLQDVIAAVQPNLLELSVAGSGIALPVPKLGAGSPRSRNRYLLNRLNLGFNVFPFADARRTVFSLEAFFPHLQFLGLQACGLAGRAPDLCSVGTAEKSGKILDISFNAVRQGFTQAATLCQPVQNSDGTNASRNDTAAVYPVPKYHIVDFSSNGARMDLQDMYPFFRAGALAVLQGNRVQGCPFDSVAFSASDSLQQNSQRKTLRTRGKWLAHVSRTAVLCRQEVNPGEVQYLNSSDGSRPSALHVHDVRCSTCTVVSVLIGLSLGAFLAYGAYRVYCRNVHGGHTGSERSSKWFSCLSDVCCFKRSAVRPAGGPVPHSQSQTNIVSAPPVFETSQISQGHECERQNLIEKHRTSSEIEI